MDVHQFIEKAAGPAIVTDEAEPSCRLESGRHRPAGL